MNPADPAGAATAAFGSGEFTPAPNRDRMGGFVRVTGMPPIEIIVTRMAWMVDGPLGRRRARSHRRFVEDLPGCCGSWIERDAGESHGAKIDLGLRRSTPLGAVGPTLLPVLVMLQIPLAVAHQDVQYVACPPRERKCSPQDPDQIDVGDGNAHRYTSELSHGHRCPANTGDVIAGLSGRSVGGAVAPLLQLWRKARAKPFRQQRAVRNQRKNEVSTRRWLQCALVRYVSGTRQ